jgi:hypothetical protein
LIPRDYALVLFAILAVLVSVYCVKLRLRNKIWFIVLNVLVGASAVCEFYAAQEIVFLISGILMAF